MVVRFSSSAIDEVEQAARYYESEVVGLGKVFLEKLQDGVSEVKQFPSASRIISGDFRRHLLSRFPYGIIYRIEEDSIFVAGVMHLRRKPDYWKKIGQQIA